MLCYTVWKKMGGAPHWPWPRSCTGVGWGHTLIYWHCNHTVCTLHCVDHQICGSSHLHYHFIHNTLLYTTHIQFCIFCTTLYTTIHTHTISYFIHNKLLYTIHIHIFMFYTQHTFIYYTHTILYFIYNIFLSTRHTLLYV